jgi:hypothetical protein
MGADVPGGQLPGVVTGAAAGAPVIRDVVAEQICEGHGQVSASAAIGIVALMTALCPECGGSQLRQIAPGAFECVSLIDISHPSPGGMMHGHIRCGHRFQVGSLLSGPCAMPDCGFDSIATCQGGCRRRLCLKHADSGPTTCSDCAQKRADAATQQQRERDAAAAEEFEETRQRVLAVLEVSNDPREVAEALTSAVVAKDDRPLVTVDECRDAWIRIVAAGLAGAPTHELTTAVGSKTWICLSMQWPVPVYDPGWLWHERRRDARVDLWEPLSRSSETREPTWLDGSGTVYRPSGAFDTKLDAWGWRSKCLVVVAREGRFRTRASGTAFGLRIRSATRSLVDGRVVTKDEPAASAYRAAVASVLRSGIG